jgi:hypothetical protein
VRLTSKGGIGLVDSIGGFLAGRQGLHCDLLQTNLPITHVLSRFLPAIVAFA